MSCNACGDHRCNASLSYDQADSLDYFDAAAEAAPTPPEFRHVPGQLDLLDALLKSVQRSVAPVDRAFDGGI